MTEAEYSTLYNGKQNAEIMSNDLISEILMRQYLLGELTEAENARLEDSVFANEDLRCQLQEIENDLIDDYARGELPASNKKNFERMFLNSEERLRKIEFAKTFHQLEIKNAAHTANVLPNSAAMMTDSNGKSFSARFLDLFRAPQTVFTSLAVLLLVMAAIIFITLSKPDNEIAEQKIGTPPATEQTNIASPAINLPVNISPKIENRQTSNNSNHNAVSNTTANRPPRDSNQSAPKVPPAPVLATLVFPSGVTREEGGQRLQLKLSAQTTMTRLVFILEKGDEFKNYRIELQKNGANVLQASLKKTGNQVILNVPAAKLLAGNYEAVLRGFNSDGQSETIGYYSFEIVKP